MIEPLVSVRRRLIAWYVGVFAVVLVLFGTSTLLVVEREIGAQLDRSLGLALDEIGRTSDLGGLRIPGRELYVFDGTGRAIRPAEAPSWVSAAAARALGEGEISLVYEDEQSDRDFQARARPFAEPGTGRPLVGVVVADVIEIEESYPRLVFAFDVAGALALLLVAIGGTWLARRAMRPAEAAFDEMRRFTADAAHQLRTPLSVIRSRAEVTLRRDRDPDEYRAALRDVTAEAGRLGGVVEKLLTLARADAGEVALRKDNLFLDDVVEDALVTLRPVAKDREVAIDVESPEGVPVAGDETLLQQLVIILVDNALRFSPSHGRVRVSVGTSGAKARLLVQDEGPGIAAHELERVFERFYRGDPTRGREAGAGLGLAIARWITDVHGGSIRLRSTHGAGTTAEVELPARVG